MDKTLIQNIIAVTNKAIDTTSVKYTIQYQYVIDFDLCVFDDCIRLNVL